jgi:hypothetical protein
MVLKVLKKTDNRWYYHDAYTIALGEDVIEVIYRDSKHYINKSEIEKAYIVNDRGQNIERLRL